MLDLNLGYDSARGGHDRAGCVRIGIWLGILECYLEHSRGMFSDGSTSAHPMHGRVDGVLEDRGRPQHSATIAATVAARRRLSIKVSIAWGHNSARHQFIAREVRVLGPMVKRHLEEYARSGTPGPTE